MTTPELRPIRTEEPVPADNNPIVSLNKPSRFIAIKNFALAAAAGFFLLNVLEQLELNWRLNSVFASASDRFVLLAYSSINILIGAIVGLVAGVGMFLVSAIYRFSERALSRLRLPTSVCSALALMFSSGVAAIILNQLSRINTFTIGVIRELEKIRPLRETLLNHERSASYLMLMAIVLACSLITAMVRASGGMGRYLRLLWIGALSAAILVVYYVDSRVEVQAYEFTMHRSLYLTGVVLAMALAGTLCGPYSQIRSVWEKQGARLRRVLGAAAMAFLIASVVFTFLHFGTNHSLKTIIFYRSTQAKQNFKLAWWILDWDRDGYSSLLDGGDADDSNPEINPGRAEKVGDQIDNNGLGGDLTQPDLDLWRKQHSDLNPRSVSGARRFNVIYFFIDTVRADHLGTYGYRRSTTPNIDHLSERSVVFENAFSPAARTAEAIPRFMQSSYWDARIASWPELLAHNDYQVMLFPGRRSWERYSRMMPVVPGSQGKPLKESIDFIIETLGKSPADRAFCAYVYIPDPHRPYVHHPEFDFGPSITDLYDGELAYTDFHVGRLLDWLEQSGRFQDTMIVLMADHGESLGERDVYRHATQLYNEQTHVPMIVYCPGMGPRRVSDYVSTIDLGSTILTTNGIAAPEEYIGVSLLPLMKGEPFRRPPVYAEMTGEEISQFVRLDQQVHPETKKYMTITQDGFKMIFNRDVFTFELYDLKNDPKEERNLYSRMPKKAAEIKDILLRYVDVVTASRPADADEGRYSKATGADGDKVED